MSPATCGISSITCRISGASMTFGFSSDRGTEISRVTMVYMMKVLYGTSSVAVKVAIASRSRALAFSRSRMRIRNIAS